MKNSWYHLFVDARNVIIPSHFEGSLTNDNGENIRGIVCFFETILQLLKEFSPQSLNIMWSGGVSEQKRLLYPEYTHRRYDLRPKNENSEIDHLIKQAQEICAAIPLRQVHVAGVETEDAIGYLARILQKPKLIISSNKDYFQILNETTQIFDHKSNLLISEYEAEELLGFNHKYYLLWKCIIGDSSKNVHGIKGIGRVRATRLIKYVTCTGKKFPINPVEQKILDRNKFLFTIGQVLNDEEKQKILEQFQKERKKPQSELNEKRLKELKSNQIIDEIRELLLKIHIKCPPGVTLQ